jgi:Tripartite tricarboxylate transporter TctB family
MDSVGWMALGATILIASILMDRLEQQHINPYTIPGLLPGLLGIAMIVLGGLLALRSWRRGGVKRPPSNPTAQDRAQRRRLWMVIALCMTFDVALVGHGLPFWLAAWTFVTTAILLLQHGARKAAGQKLTARVWLKAGAIGLGAGLAITLVFQEIFLVHLP